MKQELIEKYNNPTLRAISGYNHAREANFPCVYFTDRIRCKLMDSGYLPQRGTMVIPARYTNSAANVTQGFLSSIESVGAPREQAGLAAPWLDMDEKRWCELCCGLTSNLFDAGIVAALTRGNVSSFDPIVKNGGLSIWGDVGYVGLRAKATSFINQVGGKDAAGLTAEIGDCALLHLYADEWLVKRAFKEQFDLRERFLRGACEAAYIAGAVYAEYVEAAK